MAEKLQDADDLLLANLLRAESIEDAGFSRRIVARIRRRIWLRRLALPSAMLFGGAIAGKSLLQFGSILTLLGNALPDNLLAESQSVLAQVPMLLTMGCLMLIGIITFKLSEE
jgi:hypothetical protein